MQQSRWHHRPLLTNQTRSYSQSISQCFRILCHASRSALCTWSDVQRLLLILVCRVSNRGRGKTKMIESLRIFQLINKSTRTVTDASHGLHMPESQNDSDNSFGRRLSFIDGYTHTHIWLHTHTSSHTCMHAWIHFHSIFLVSQKRGVVNPIILLWLDFLGQYPTARHPVARRVDWYACTYKCMRMCPHLCFQRCDLSSLAFSDLALTRHFLRACWTQHPIAWC